MKGACNFEANFCNWEQSNDDNFEWSLGNNGTSSSGTGPSLDHSTNTQLGRYAFIEARFESFPSKNSTLIILLYPLISSPRLPGDKARLFYKDTLPKGGRYCLKMFYHMYGNSIGTLNVYVVPVGENISPVYMKWSEAGNQGDIWRKAETTVTNIEDDFQVI